MQDEDRPESRSERCRAKPGSAAITWRFGRSRGLDTAGDCPRTWPQRTGPSCDESVTICPPTLCATESAGTLLPYGACDAAKLLHAGPNCACARAEKAEPRGRLPSP